MNAILRNLRVKDRLDIPAKGDSDETLKEETIQPNLTPAIGVVTYNGLITGNPNLDAKIILLSLLARYDS